MINPVNSRPVQSDDLGITGIKSESTVTPAARDINPAGEPVANGKPVVDGRPVVDREPDRDQDDRKAQAISLGVGAKVDRQG